VVGYTEGWKFRSVISSRFTIPGSGVREYSPPPEGVPRRLIRIFERVYRRRVNERAFSKGRRTTDNRV